MQYDVFSYLWFILNFVTEATTNNKLQLSVSCANTVQIKTIFFCSCDVF
jgi:hypothetical protein